MEETLTLTDDQVKVHLRHAVTAGIIWGWYRHLPLRGREWVVNPMAGPCVSYDREGIRSFCAMLAPSGAATPPRGPRGLVRARTRTRRALEFPA